MKKSIRVIVVCMSGILFACIFVSLPGLSKKDALSTASQAGSKLSRDSFHSVPDSSRLWVYYWWLKGNVSRESITNDLEEMKKKGIGGLLLFDSRGYGDLIPLPLKSKFDFMSPEWREMVKYTLQEAARLGLKVSINLANTGGALRGPWDLGSDGPKKLVWTSKNVRGPIKFSETLQTPARTRYYQDVALMAVKIKSAEFVSEADSSADLNGKWKEIKEPGKDAEVVEKAVFLNKELKDGQLQWDIPEGDWKILRFGLTVIGDTGSVDILNKESVTKYFNLYGKVLINDAGTLAGNTLKYFYNVSWEGANPNWTKRFEQEFVKFRGYEIGNYMPVLAGMVVEDHSISMRFMRDYFSTLSDCFRENCYRTIGQLCNDRGIKWHAENGGPWKREAAMFKEADFLSFLGENDVPQGEFWAEYDKSLPDHSNSRYTSMAANIYGKPISAIEAFTTMIMHYSEYPEYLKPYADKNFIDGSNLFIWHTFTSSPPELGKPGYEYFAGTHLNPRVTWWEMSGDFINYLGRCQYMLQQGNYVADVCCYNSYKNFPPVGEWGWGRGFTWDEKSSLRTVPGQKFDLLNTDVLLNRLTVKDGKLVLPGGMNYQLLVVDLKDQTIPEEALKKIIELAKSGATIVLGQNKPGKTAGLKDYPEVDVKTAKMADELWGDNDGKSTHRHIGKGAIFSGTPMEEVLKHTKIAPDFEGPFEYIHRSIGNEDIYFLRGTGKAECTFRVDGKKPEIWNPVNGKVSDPLSYHFTDDNRTIVTIKLPENGSAFVVFSDRKEKNYITSVTGPEDGLEIKEHKEDTVKLVLWKSGNYSLMDALKKTQEVNSEEIAALELKGPWEVVFTPGWGAPEKATFKDLILWNNHPDKGIKYFSGTGTYKQTFNLTADQIKGLVRLQLGQVFNIARVRINGKDLGVLWTAPWTVEISGAVKTGENELEIEVANLWVNRLIGDAGLPESKRYTTTNIRLLPDNVYSGSVSLPYDMVKNGRYLRWTYISSKDSLLPSGLIGPVRIEFGKEQIIKL